MIKNSILPVILLTFLFSNAVAENDGSIAQKAQNTQSTPPSDDQIPILGWYSIPASQTSVERYKELKDAGISYSLSFLPSIEEVKKALDVAEQAGVKLLVSCPELKKETEKTVKQLKGYPALAGYHLQDEPSMKVYPELAAWAKRIQSVDNKHFCYVNLFPNFAGLDRLGAESYSEYVQEYINQIPVQFISFDYYPVLKDHLQESWYENLEVISKESNEAEKPFWAFVLTTTYDDDHVTPQTIAAMRLQAFSDLAYGAQGIQYFSYWSATSISVPSGEDHRGAPISATGKRSIVYDRVKQLSEEIQDLSGVFLGAKVLSVRHTGQGRIPKGTIRLTSLPEPVKVLDTHGSPALISVLQKGEYSFLVIVNKDFLNNMKYTIYGDNSLQRVLKDGTVVPAAAYEPFMELDPGDIAVYMFPTEKNQK